MHFHRACASVERYVARTHLFFNLSRRRLLVPTGTRQSSPAAELLHFLCLSFFRFFYFTVLRRFVQYVQQHDRRQLFSVYALSRAALRVVGLSWIFL